ncbi:hypothetical protein [Teredinibacter turnerae]|nr:hypothetical protein [Teredinibacter turnerae]
MEVGTPLLYRSGSNVISTRFVDLDICHDMLCVKIQIQDPKKGNGIQYVLEQSLSDLSLQSNPESLRIGKSLKALSEEVCRVFGSGCTNFISELYDTVGLVGSKNGILEELDSLEFKSAKFNESLEFASVSSLIRPQNIPLYEDSPFSFIYSDGKVGSRSQLNTEEILCFRGASKSLKFWDMFPCASKVFVSEAAEIHCSTLIKKFNEAYTGRSQTEFEIPFFAPDSIMFSAFISR